MRDVIRQSVDFFRRDKARHRILARAVGSVDGLFVELFLEKIWLSYTVSARLPRNGLKGPPEIGDYYYERHKTFRKRAKAERYFGDLQDRYRLRVEQDLNIP